MPESQRSPSTRFSRFFAELRRRHVVRVTVAYAAVVFVVLQAAEIVFPPFGIPDRVLRLLVVFGVLGFPVVVVLAWIYEVTPQGVRSMADLDAEAGEEPRSQDNGDLLPRLALLVVTVLAVGGAGWWWVGWGAPAAREGAGVPAHEEPSTFQPASLDDRDVPIRSLAVLPFQDFSPGGGEEYFAKGMHEALISRLSQLGSVRVVSRTSVMYFDREGKSVARIGSELGVEGIVEGSVLRDGDRVRITVQLIHAPSDTHVLSKTYEREVEDIIRLQREVAAAIAGEIQGELAEEEQTTDIVASGDTPRSTDPDAATEEMKGRMELAEGTPEALESAELHFRQALQADSNYAPALAGLAGSRLLKGLTANEEGDARLPAEALESAGGYVDRALRLDPESREARELRVLIRDYRSRMPPPGAPAPPGRDSIRIITSDSTVPEDFIPAVTDLGTRIAARMAEVQARISRVPGQQIRSARNLVAAGEHGIARGILRSTVETYPDFEPAWEELERLYVMEEQLDSVVDLRRARVEALGPSAPGAPSVADLARGVEEAGAGGYWEWRLRELTAREEAGERIAPMAWATAHAALGHSEPAFEHLVDAATRGDPGLAALRSDPVWDPYRQDPRFAGVIHQILRVRGPSGR